MSDAPNPSEDPADPNVESNAPADGDEHEDAWVDEEEFEEPITDKFDLRAVAEKLATERRRTTAGQLRVQRSSKDEVLLPLDRSETTIGRDPACDIVLPGPGVSRRHASIRRTEAGYFELRDLSSTNGTRVAQDPVREMILLDQDRFRIGDVQFTLEIHAVEYGTDDG